MMFDTLYSRKTMVLQELVTFTDEVWKGIVTSARGSDALYIFSDSIQIHFTKGLWVHKWNPVQILLIAMVIIKIQLGDKFALATMTQLYNVVKWLGVDGWNVCTVRWNISGLSYGKFVLSHKRN